MPVPDEHLSALSAELDRHEQELLRLRAQQVRLNTEVAVHKTILALGRDGRIRALLDHLVDHRADATDLVGDSARLLELFDIRFPSWLEVAAEPTPCLRVRADFSVNGSRFFVQWDESAGFTAGDDEVR